MTAETYEAQAPPTRERPNTWRTNHDRPQLGATIFSGSWLVYVAIAGLIVAALLVAYFALPTEAAPPAFQVLAGCEVLDLAADGTPDVVSCNGAAFNLSPFGASP